MRTLKIRQLLALTIALTAVASCNRKHQRVVAVIPKSQSHIFWQTVHAGAAAAGKELNVEVRWNGPASETDFARQVTIVEDFINQHVDGIAVAPQHGESLVPVVERAGQEHIPVVIYDSGIKSDKYISYVSTDNYHGGVLAAERMATILPGEGKIAILATLPGSVSTTERENGFKDTIAKKAPGLKIVELQYGMSDRSRSLAVAEDMLAAHPDLAGMFCSNESGAIGGVQAAKSKGVAGKLKIVGFDSSPTLIEDMQAGVLDSLVVQNPFRMGYLAVQSLVNYLDGHPPEKRIDTGATVVTAANLKEPAVQELLNPPIDKYLK